jgi:glucose-1-phosphate cytidylyltransferase
MKVVILCGGRGTRLREDTELKPKPTLEARRRTAAAYRDFPS